MNSGSFKGGHKHSREAIEKLRVAGKKLVGAKNPFFGKEHSPEALTKMRHTQFKKGLTPWNAKTKGIMKANSGSFKSRDFQGDKHPGWKGGEISYRKKIVKERDMGICQICELHEPDIMQVDHIIPVWEFPEGELIISNMRLLCPNCHMRKSQKERRKYNELRRK